MQDLAFASATEQADLVRRAEVSPVELVELYLSRIEKLNDRLGAYLTVAADQALDAGRGAEAMLGDADLPPFHGVPISIKDLADTAGIRTTHGSRGFADRVPDVDREVVAKLKLAGFIVLGKTNTPEFGTTPWTEPEGFPPARNPWDPERTPGGSSGGAAAAVAAGLCPVAHGSDGGGSIRIPASCTGLFGIKPSRGRVSAAPAPQSTLSEQGPLTRTVLDAAGMLDAMAGYVTGDAWWAPPPMRPFREEVGRDPGKLRVAVTSEPPNDADIAPANRAAASAMGELLSELGHDVVEVSPPWLEGLTDAFLTLWCVGRAAYHPMPPIETVGELNRALIEIGSTTTAPAFAEAQGRILTSARTLVGFFERYDVLVTPTVAATPPKIGEHRRQGEPFHEFMAASGFVPFTPPFNTTGQPAVSVPWEHDSSGMPLGVQIVGRPADEATLFRLSAQIEEARPWADRRPPVS